MLELNITLLGDFMYLLQRNGMATHPVSIVVQPFLLAVGDIIDENSSSSNTVLCPVTNSNPGAVAIGNLIRSGAAVPSTSSILDLRAEVAKSVPLRRCLWVETPDIVPGDAFVIWDRDNLVLSRESIETCYGCLGSTKNH